MVAYAHDTQHEKIIRGLAIGLALIMFGQEENSESLVEQVCSKFMHPVLAPRCP